MILFDSQFTEIINLNMKPCVCTSEQCAIRDTRKLSKNIYFNFMIALIINANARGAAPKGLKLVRGKE